MEAKKKTCGICGKSTIMWKAKTRDNPQMCKDCYNKPKVGDTFKEKEVSYDSNGVPYHKEFRVIDIKPSNQKPITKVSQKQLERLKLYKKAKEEHFDKYPNCQYPGCTNRDRQLHHMCGRVGDLLFDKRYFKTLCDKHHRFVENNPTEAKRLKLSGDRLDK